VIVLASGSPRRRLLLELLRIPFEIVPPDVDEDPEDGEPAESVAVRLARAKAQWVAARRPDALVLAADTVVSVDGRVLGKPADPRDAATMLATLSGRSHRVVTGVALVAEGEVSSRCDITRVWFRELDRELIDAYVETGEPLDKAGGYGLQGFGSVLVDRIDGDCFGVMGLPLRLVAELLEAAGMPYRFNR
jgi:septum formation protein